MPSLCAATRRGATPSSAGSPASRGIILYFHELRNGQPVTFSYQLRAKFPVRAKTPLSTAYQYYEPAVRDTVPPIKLSIL